VQVRADIHRGVDLNRTLSTELLAPKSIQRRQPRRGTTVVRARATLRGLLQGACIGERVDLAPRRAQHGGGICSWSRGRKCDIACVRYDAGRGRTRSACPFSPPGVTCTSMLQASGRDSAVVLKNAIPPQVLSAFSCERRRRAQISGPSMRSSRNRRTVMSVTAHRPPLSFARTQASAARREFAAGDFAPMPPSAPPGGPSCHNLLLLCV